MKCKTIKIKRNGMFIINKSVYAEPLENMPYAQAYIKRYDNRIDLISYQTHVASIIINNDNTKKIECYGLYSNTTRRHISSFARQFGYDYYDFKNAYLNN